YAIRNIKSYHGPHSHRNTRTNLHLVAYRSIDANETIISYLTTATDHSTRNDQTVLTDLNAMRNMNEVVNLRAFTYHRCTHNTTINTNVVMKRYTVFDAYPTMMRD